MSPLPAKRSAPANIDGVIVKHLRPIPDERGRLLEIFRADDPFFEKFGQVYITTTLPGVTKAWHVHRLQTDHLAVISGMMRVGLFDSRLDSPTCGLVQEFFAGVHNPILIRVPPGVYHGIQCIGTEEAMMLNVPSEPHNAEHPDEYRLAPNDPSIPFDWSRHDR